MATITITPGNSFTATETVTSTKLNDLGSPTAALTAASIGTADIADDAITPALIADNAVTTPAILDANVTFAKLTDVIDDDTMATATDTTLATSESIKAYVDTTAGPTVGFTPTATAGDTKSVTLPNGLIMKFGRVSASGSTTTTVNFSDFGGNFTNNVFSVVLTPESASSGSSNPTRLNAQPTTSSFVIRNLLGTVNVNFVAIGR
jgi:hypothetical protein